MTVSLVPSLVIIPLLGMALTLLTPKKRAREIRRAACAFTLIPFLIAVGFFFAHDRAAAGFQHVAFIPWLPALGLNFRAGLDGIGVTMILLHGFLSFSGALVSRSIVKGVKSYFVFYLLLVASIYGVFISLDLFFLYLFYEMSVIPMFPLIGVWGGQNREYASMKLTLYISLGAVLALIGLILIYLASGLRTFDLSLLAAQAAAHPFPRSFQIGSAALLIFGFGVIASLWPFHSWSPIGYAAAPSAVSMLHAGVLKKLGIFLIIRTVLTLLPEGARFWLPVVSVLCVVNILYGAWAAMAQKDMKFTIGFASVSHMGYAFLGLACLNETGLTGTVFFMFAHGIMAALCFALIGFIYDQTHTRLISDLGGLAKKLPFISACFLIAAFASSGLPGLANFVSEILIFFGAWKTLTWQTLAAVFGIVLTAVYMLRLIRNVFFGPEKPAWMNIADAKGFAAKLPYGLLAGALVVFGIWPSFLLDVIRPAAAELIKVYGRYDIVFSVTQEKTK